MSFGYFYGDQSESYSFYRFPKQLMTGEQFKRLSMDAKVLYGLMLDRMGLSAKNGWRDELGRVFIYYTLTEIQEDFNCGHDRVLRMLAELDAEKGIGLIVSGVGRGVALDRDQNWAKVERAYRSLTEGKGEVYGE